MADRYWVGGTAAWNATAGTKWATSSGGLGGASVPTTADDVFFDNLSTGTCTISAGNTGAKSIDCTGFTGTLGSNQGITVAGSITLVAGMGYTYTGLITITGTGTLTTAGKTLANVTINGAGITVTLGDALTISTNNNLTLTAGTFDANNNNITAGTFNSSNSNTRTINLGSSTVTLSNLFPWDIATTTGLTYSGASATINIATSSFATFAGGGLTYNAVNFTSTALSSATISGANTFSTLSVAARSASGMGILSLSANQIITNSFSVQSGATDPTRRLFIRSDVQGTPRTITSASNTIWGADFRDGTGPGVASWSESSRTNYWGDCEGNSGITFSAGQTVYWNLAGIQNWSATGWALNSGGTPAAANFPLVQDTTVIDNAGAAGTIATNASWNIGTIDMSNRTSAVTISFVTSFLIYGNWTNGSGTTTSGSSASLFFVGRTTQFITSAGKTFSASIIIQSFSGVVQLVDSLTNSVNFLVNSGTFNANNQNITASQFFSNTSDVRTITMGSGTWTLTGVGTVWSTGTTTNLTFNKDTANIFLSNTSASSRTFTGGALTFNTITIGGTTGTSTTTFGATAGTIIGTLASTKTVAHTISFSAPTTINNWTVTGTAGNLVTISGGTIIKGGGGVVSDLNYLNVQNSNASPADTWYAGTNSTDSGGNTGWIFSGYYANTIVEAISLGDNETVVLGYNTTITENVTANDLPNTTAAFNASEVENINVADVTECFGFGTIDNTQNTVWVPIDNRQ